MNTVPATSRKYCLVKKRARVSAAQTGALYLKSSRRRKYSVIIINISAILSGTALTKPYLQWQTSKNRKAQIGAVYEREYLRTILPAKIPENIMHIRVTI